MINLIFFNYPARLINDFLTSGHPFIKDENLSKFRFGLLNSLMLLSIFLTIFNYFSSILAFVNFGNIFEAALLIYLIISLPALFLLRKHKDTYFMVVIFFIITSLSLFYFILITRKEDEFRLIAFFLSIFITYVLLGRKYGISISLLN
jgi:hypothetical protein